MATCVGATRLASFYCFVVLTPFRAFTSYYFGRFGGGQYLSGVWRFPCVVSLVFTIFWTQTVSLFSLPFSCFGFCFVLLLFLRVFFFPFLPYTCPWLMTMFPRCCGFFLLVFLLVFVFSRLFIGFVFLHFCSSHKWFWPLSLWRSFCPFSYVSFCLLLCGACALELCPSWDPWLHWSSMLILAKYCLFCCVLLFGRVSTTLLCTSVTLITSPPCSQP